MLGQQTVDYQAALSYHVPRDLAESEAAARQTVSSLPANAVVFTESKEHFTLGYVAEFQLGRHRGTRQPERLAGNRQA